METKICNCCEIPKELKEFYKNKAREDDLDYLCKKCRSEYNKKNKKKNAVKVKERARKYYKKNSKKINLQRKEYRKTHKAKYKYKCRKESAKKRWEKARANPVFRLNNNMRNGIRKSLKGNMNGNHWEKLVKYTRIDLFNHLESQFKEGMTWENYGRWHIDHKIPKSLFNITSAKSKGFKACWALENLRPMWAEDNLNKHNKIFF